MNERFKKITTTIKEKWSGFSNAVRVMIIAIPIAVIAIIILLVNLINHKNDAVLYSGLNNDEITEITTALSNMGVTDVKLSNGDIIVPDDQVDYLRMQLAVQGYPKDNMDYSIWNDGINLWSTDSDKRVVAQQQREARIQATLRQLDEIQQAIVNLSIPQTRDYVITEEKEVPSCSITLKLKNDEELTNSEVRAIFALVSKAVEGLTYDNITVVDTQGRSYEWVSPEEEEAEGKDASGVPIARKRFLFQRDMQSAIMSDINTFMSKIYGPNGYAVNVSARLNYDAKDVVDTEYIPVEGTNAGVKEQEDHVQWNNNLENADGLVGFTPNADNSPDYPTLDGLEDGQSYYYNKDQIQYDVSNIVTKIQKDGYDIENLSVGVAINTAAITDAQREAIQITVAKAAGTEVDNVSVLAQPFALISPTVDSNTPTTIWTRQVDSYRNMMLFLVIALGVILIGLIIASLCMSNSRKKKIRRRQEQALLAAQTAGAELATGSDALDTAEEVDFNIASLTQEAGKESRETILKREIAEFAKSSPDIVASIIRNMLRDEG